MTKVIEITIENKFTLERRDLNVYHHATKSAHMISHNSSITLPLKTAGESDYIYISIVSGPGNLGHTSFVSLPAWMNFEFLAEGQLKVMRSDERTFLKIPPGPPEWKLKLTSATSTILGKWYKVVLGEEGIEKFPL